MGLKEAFRAIYRAPDRGSAKQRLDAFLAAVEGAGIPAVDAFAKGIRIWREELLAYFDEPTSNGTPKAPSRHPGESARTRNLTSFLGLVGDDGAAR